MKTDAARARIAHVLPFPEIGGTELQTLRIAETARELGFSSTVYVPDGARSVTELFEDHGFETEDYAQVPPSYSHPLPFLRATWALAARFRAQGAAVVHCADVLAGIFTATAGRLAGARVLCHVRNPYPAIPMRERPFLWPVDRFAFVSRDVQRQLSVAARRKRGPVIYGVASAVEERPRGRQEACARFGLPVDCLVVGAAARLAPQKDYETLVRAAREVLRAAPGVRFLIAADTAGTEAQRMRFRGLQTLLDETGTRDLFVFAGFQPDMSWFYAAIDALALSSHFEGLGTVLMEAIAHRKPIVATAVGGIPEAILDGKTGLLAPPRSPEIFARQLVRVLREPELARTLTAAAWAHSESLFGRERYVRQIDELYSGLVGRA